MKKIKPIAKKHRFRNWIKRLFGIKQPSKIIAEHLARGIDEMHLVSYPQQILGRVEVSVDVLDDHLRGLPLTEAEWRARIQRELAEKLTREIIEKELYTITKHEDVIRIKTHYRASVKLLVPKKEESYEPPT